MSQFEAKQLDNEMMLVIATDGDVTVKHRQKIEDDVEEAAIERKLLILKANVIPKAKTFDASKTKPEIIDKTDKIAEKLAKIKKGDAVK